ncbi:hypothetical protein [Kitasatospora purpeofusca]|uniref:hypothetical protein n=1 Tax=Kitasatospora purpeofusca TaxID=67352 RepID=UPI003679048A
MSGLITQDWEGNQSVETVGWTTAITAVFGALLFLANMALDAVPPLSRKVVKAIRSLREVVEEVRHHRHPKPLSRQRGHKR